MAGCGGRFSGGKTGDEGSTKNYVGMSLCSIGAILVMYALFQFYRRARKIRLALEGPYEDLFGPGFAALLVIASLLGLATWSMYKIV